MSKAPLLGFLLGAALVRLVGMILGLWYGPWLYLIFPLCGLFLSLDFLTIYMVYASNLEEPIGTGEKITKLAWVGLNTLAILGLVAVEIIFMVQIGFWSMAYTPVLLAMFIVILTLIVVVVFAIMALMASLKRPAYKGLGANHTVTY